MKYRPITGDLTIAYPCRWVYKIFGKDPEQMREAACEVLPGHDYTITPSHSSRHKNYHCLNLDITVSDEKERTEIYEALRGHCAILLVL